MISSYRRRFVVEVLEWPLYSRENNIFSHDGNPSVSEFHCDITRTGSDVQCDFTDIVNTNIKEYAICGNRGKCNFHDGECECFDGFSGTACYNIISDYDKPSTTGMRLHLDGSEYSSTMIQLHSERASSGDFDFISATASDKKVFYVRGDGRLYCTSMTIESGEYFCEHSGTSSVYMNITLLVPILSKIRWAHGDYVWAIDNGR